MTLIRTIKQTILSGSVSVSVTAHQKEQVSSRTRQDNEMDQKSCILQAFETTKLALFYQQLNLHDNLKNEYLNKNKK